MIKYSVNRREFHEAFLSYDKCCVRVHDWCGRVWCVCGDNRDKYGTWREYGNGRQHEPAREPGIGQCV